MSKKTKRYLMLLVAVGLIAVAAGGSGTFASFNAQVTNANNVFATGTLFLHDTKQNGNICRSEDNGGNVNAACQVLINSLGHKPGDTDFANIELANAGSLDASALTFSATCDDATRPTIATAGTYASGTYTSGSPLTLSLTGPHQALVKGTALVLFDGTHTDNLTVLTTVPAFTGAGASTVDVTGTSTAGMTSAAAVRLAATFGSGALCSASTGVQFSVQETDNSWSAATGKCVYPASATACAFSQTLGTAVLASPINLTSALWPGAGMTTALDAGGTRYFKVSVKMPDGLLNAAQNSQAKFDLTWHIDQA
jgi:predicted ribosomally synthesized peptide with SipW-like signal peptide